MARPVARARRCCCCRCFAARQSDEELQRVEARMMAAACRGRTEAKAKALRRKCDAAARTAGLRKCETMRECNGAYRLTRRRAGAARALWEPQGLLLS